MKFIKNKLAWLLAVVALAGAFFLYNSGKQKETENATLRQDVQELPTLRAENEELKKVQVQGDELARLRKDNEDLLRLRNEVRQLRDEKKALTQQAQTAQAAVQQAQAQAQAVQSQMQTLRTGVPPATQAQTPEQQAFAARYGLQVAPDQQIRACINNLRQIDGAKQQWALENKKPGGAFPNANDVLPYFQNKTMPACPAGGTYTLNPVALAPTCNIPGHALPQ